MIFMKLSDIIANSEFFTDENADTTNYLSLANKALSIVNVECKTLFPFMTSESEDYKKMPKNWLFALLSPYLSYGVKMNDSSLSEADRYLDEFYRALDNFKQALGDLVSSYDPNDSTGNSGISPDLVKQEGFGGVYNIDTSNAIDVGFFGSDSNGGNW